MNSFYLPIVVDFSGVQRDICHDLKRAENREKEAVT